MTTHGTQTGSQTGTQNGSTTDPQNGSPTSSPTDGQTAFDAGTKAAAEAPALPKNVAENPILSRWVHVHADGTVDVRVGKVEFGQGILSALAQLVADELDVELGQVRMLPANTASGPDEGITSGSMSVAESGAAVRLVTANVRALFVREAARRWGVAADQVTVRRGQIVSSQSATATSSAAATSYGELALAVDLGVAADPGIPVRPAEQQRIAGTSTARLDLPDKVAGRARFIHDMRLPGQLFGRVLRPPSPGARLVSLDASAVADLNVEVVRDGSFLGVIGVHEAETTRALEALRGSATWDEHETLPDEDDLDSYLRAGPHETIPVVEDDPSTQPSQGQRTLRASYSRPFLAHASMAPSCGVAWWRDDDHLMVWSHSQAIFNLRDAIAQALNLDPASVTVEHAEGAGCYGHNGADDAAFDAVLLARTVPGRPLQVQWSRGDELSWSPFGSAMAVDVAATMDEHGKLTSWEYDVWGQGHTTRPGYAGSPGLLAATHLEHPLTYPAAVDPPAVRGGGTSRNALPIYQIPHRRVTGHRLLQTSVRSSALRSLGAFMNVFAIESFMDELSRLAGQDPVAYRLAHLEDERGRRVLQAAAEAAGWGRDTPEGVGMGVGFARYKDKGAYCAVVAEVEAEHDIRVRRLTIAVDVGQVVNPDGVRNQIEGGATQATSWTIKERVRFDRTRVTSVDWETYPILRFSEAPQVDVEIVSSPGLPSVGSGEAAQGPTAAAIANAVADAIGVRVRNLPLTTEAVVAAIESEHG
jgi:nicotinate dehydrogenase subunit B